MFIKSKAFHICSNTSNQPCAKGGLGLVFKKKFPLALIVRKYSLIKIVFKKNFCGCCTHEVETESPI